MCFNVIEERKRVKIAKKDIECYKWLVKNTQHTITKYFSPYRNYVYTKNEVTPLIKIKLKNDITGRPLINEGYHSCNSLTFVISYMSMSVVNGTICKFIIPKGTRYYENTFEYVSEQIIFLGEEKF